MIYCFWNIWTLRFFNIIILYDLKYFLAYCEAQYEKILVGTSSFLCWFISLFIKFFCEDCFVLLTTSKTMIFEFISSVKMDQCLKKYKFFGECWFSFIFDNGNMYTSYLSFHFKHSWIFSVTLYSRIYFYFRLFSISKGIKMNRIGPRPRQTNNEFLWLITILNPIALLLRFLPIDL